MTEPAAALYAAIDAFQREHRIPGLQHAQIRGLLAEHLARVVPVPPADQTTDRAALRQRIAEVLTGAYLTAPDDSAIMEVLADAVLAVLPEPADRAAVLREAATRYEEILANANTGQDPRYWTAVRDITLGLRHMAAEAQQGAATAFAPSAPGANEPASSVAAETQPTTQPDEDPARIDRLRPEFFEHASVESIDLQIQRARRQQRHWGNRERTLAILRQARVTQKERGEWPAAGVRQDGAQR